MQINEDKFQNLFLSIVKDQGIKDTSYVIFIGFVLILNSASWAYKKCCE